MDVDVNVPVVVSCSSWHEPFTFWYGQGGGRHGGQGYARVALADAIQVQGFRSTDKK